MNAVSDSVVISSGFSGPAGELPPLLPTTISKRNGQGKTGAALGESLFSRTVGIYSGGFGTWGGWTGARLEQVRHYRLWTWKAISALGNGMAGHRPNIAFVTPRRSPVGPQHKSFSRLRHEERLRQDYSRKTLHHIQPHEDVDPAGPDHPLNRLLDNPNEWDTGGYKDIIFELTMFLELTGNAYLWVVPGEDGLPAELWVIPSHWVHGPRLDPKKGIWYYPVFPIVGAGCWFFPRDEVIHFKYKSPLHKIDGWSPTAATSEWLDTMESINFAQYASFKNGCFPYGAVELDAAFQDPDDADMERLYAKFFSRTMGEGRFGRPLILPPGAKYNPLIINPVEMNYLQSEDQKRDQILCVHDVPKEIVGIQPSGGDLSWYAPLRQFASYGLKPRMDYIGHVMTHRLAKRWDDTLRWWWDDPTPLNPQQVSADLAADLSAGVRTRNEARAERGLEPYPDEMADKLLVPPSLVALEDLGQEQGGMGDMLGGLGDEQEQPEEKPGKPSVEEGREGNPNERELEEEEAEMFAEEEEEGAPGVRPEVTRALAAVGANGHAVNGHAKTLPAPIAAAGQLEELPVVVVPKPAKPSPEESGRAFMASLYKDWAGEAARIAQDASTARVDQSADLARESLQRANAALARVSEAVAKVASSPAAASDSIAAQALGVARSLLHTVVPLKDVPIRDELRRIVQVETWTTETEPRLVKVQHIQRDANGDFAGRTTEILLPELAGGG